MRLKAKCIWLVLLSVMAVSAIVLTFRFSEETMHYHNRFIRRFPQHTAEKVAAADLRFNSYYFAGYEGNRIYLGNTTAPLQIMEIDSGLQSKKVYHIELYEKDLPFQAPRIRVDGNRFYVFEGNAPYIYRGSTHNWKAHRMLQSGRYFSQFEPVDSSHIALRYIQDNGESLIGVLNVSDTMQPSFGHEILEKQFDGIFDTDGSLHTDKTNKQLLYVYRYRNQYILADKEAKVISRGNTIDTISRAQVNIIAVPSHKKKTFSKPPLIVNKSSTYYGGLLFVNSLLPGRYEDAALWQSSSIVDVYEVSGGSYRSSFAIADVHGKKMRSMLAVAGRLYVLTDNQLDCYMLRDHLTQSRPAAIQH